MCFNFTYMLSPLINIIIFIKEHHLFYFSSNNLYSLIPWYANSTVPKTLRLSTRHLHFQKQMLLPIQDFLIQELREFQQLQKLIHRNKNV